MKYTKIPISTFSKETLVDLATLRQIAQGDDECKILENLEDTKALVRNFDDFHENKEFIRKPARKMQLTDFMNKLIMIKGLLQWKNNLLNVRNEHINLISEEFEASSDSYSPAVKVILKTIKKRSRTEI